MTIKLMLYNVTCISFFLLAFISLFNPAKVNVVANRWLSLFFAAVGFTFLNGIISDARANVQYAWLIGFDELWRFAMAPALYLAIVQFTTPGGKLRKSQYLHFIPFGLFFLYMAPALFIPGYKPVDNLINMSHLLSRVIATIISIAAKMQLLVYWALSIYQLNRHQKNIQLVSSNTAPVNLNWLKYLLISIGVMLVVLYCSLIFHIEMGGVYSALVYVAGCLAILYYSLAQKEIYPYEMADLAEINQVIHEVEENVKPAKPRLPDELSIELQARLEQLMVTDKLYLDNELNLPQLAHSMAITVHDLSYLLNDKMGVNFFQFVNAYRVEEARQIMLSDKHKHLNILGIAYSAGFSSKTTFNTAFKKQTGLSPSQYIQQAKAGVIPSVSY